MYLHLNSTFITIGKYKCVKKQGVYFKVVVVYNTANDISLLVLRLYCS
jgi:hypothetical protein